MYLGNQYWGPPQVKSGLRCAHTLIRKTKSKEHSTSRETESKAPKGQEQLLKKSSSQDFKRFRYVSEAADRGYIDNAAHGRTPGKPENRAQFIRSAPIAVQNGSQKHKQKPKLTTRDEEKELTPRQLKRLKHWSKATQKSHKDRAAHEKLAERTGNNAHRSSLSLANTPEKTTWRQFKKVELATARAKVEDEAQHAVSRIRSRPSHRRVSSIRIQRVKSSKSTIVNTSAPLRRKLLPLRRTKLPTLRYKKSLRLRRIDYSLVRELRETAEADTTRWRSYEFRKRHARQTLANTIKNLAKEAELKFPSSNNIQSTGSDKTVQDRLEEPQQDLSRVLPKLSDSSRRTNSAAGLLAQLRSRSTNASMIQKRSFSNMLPTSRVFHNYSRFELRPAMIRTSQRATVLTSSNGAARAAKLPVSPLERKLEQSKKRQTKRQPTPSEREELANNPWAVMLAGSIRRDNASGVRVPNDLLVDFGLISSPVDQQVYPMPTELADLKAFADRLKSSGKKFTKAPSRNEIKGTRLRMSPYKLLMEELTDSLKVWDESRQSSRTKNGAVLRRMIPTRWGLEFTKHTAFQSASKDYWSMREEKGELDDDVFKKPEAPFDFHRLQWQTAIADRLLNMMRQRVLIALNHVGNMRTARSAHLEKHDSCFVWPRDHSLVLDNINSGEAKQDFWNDMGDIESGVAISGTSAQQGNAKDPRPPIAVKASEISESSPPELSKTNSTVPDWLRGSFFLYLGPPSETLQALPYVESSSPDIANTDFKESKYITPMITVAQGYRLPVFNLHAILGSDFTEILAKLLRRHKNVLINGLEIDLADFDTLNHVILFRADTGWNKNGGQITLAHELWQLWRYLGGRDCLLPAHPQNDPQQVDTSEEESFEHVPKTLQARLNKNTSGYNGPTVAVWKHLYELLELPPEESWSVEDEKSGLYEPVTSKTNVE